MDDKLKGLIRKYNRSIRLVGNETEYTLNLLKEIVQRFVEVNDDKSAYVYQCKYCDALISIYGDVDKITEGPKLYKRELGIRSEPKENRTKLCREFWKEVRNQYGDDSYWSFVVLTLYTFCCVDSQENEELRIVSNEALTIFKDSVEDWGIEAYQVCKYFVTISSHEESEIEVLKQACDDFVSVFGEDNRMSVVARKFIVEKLRKSGNPDDKKVALEISKECFEMSVAADMDAETFFLSAKEYIRNLIINAEYELAGNELKKLHKNPRCFYCEDFLISIYDLYALLYSKQGKYRTALKFHKRAYEHALRFNSKDSYNVLEYHFKYAWMLFLCNKPKQSMNELCSNMKNKNRFLFELFLLRDAAVRESLFNTNDRYMMDVYILVCLEYLKKNSVSQDEANDLWNNMCTYKSLLFDCELLQGIYDKSETNKQTVDKYQNATSLEKFNEEREKLDLSRQFNYVRYLNDITLSEICDVLEENEIIIDFYLANYAEVKKEYVAWVVSKHGADFTHISECEKVDECIETLNKLIADKASVESCTDKLSEYLQLDTICNSKIKKVFISTEGILSSLPFEMLLSNDIQLNYITNIKDIVRKRRNKTGNKPIQSISVFADPKYDIGQDLNRTNEGPGLERSANVNLYQLPGTYVEALAIKSVFGDGADLFLGKNASVETLKCQTGSDVIHIASHASNFENGCIFLSGALNSLNGEQISSEYGSGLLLSKDVAAMNLQSIKLAVLSCCSTGSGENSAHYGVRCLRRAFELAGVDMVLTTLWDIDDFASALFMGQFYSYLYSGDNTFSAITKAKQYMRLVTTQEVKSLVKEIGHLLIDAGYVDTYRAIRDRLIVSGDNDLLFSHPYYWAGFVLYGN